MSVVSDLVASYRKHMELPWQQGLSAAERVWMLVYPPEQERRLRARLAELENVTTAHDRAWVVVDVTDDFGVWIACHEYADAFMDDPTDLTSALLEDFEEAVIAKVAEGVKPAGSDSVVVLLGAGALYPYLRISRVIEGVESALAGRLLVLFPGQLDPTTYTYRLLGARDGFSYRAVAITV